MANILDILFNPFLNALMSSLLFVVLIYWVISFMGIGFEEINLGIRFDTDADADLDITDGEDFDANTAQESMTNIGIWTHFMIFMNMGKVPLTMLISIWVFFTWAICLFVTQLFAFTHEVWGSVLIFIPLLLFALLLTKLASDPIALFLRKTGFHGDERINFFGCEGCMRSNIDGNKIGAAVFMVNDDPVKLNVVSINGIELKYGDKVIITEGPDEKQVYGVMKNW